MEKEEGEEGEEVEEEGSGEEEEAPVAESEGLRLHLSSSSSTGYKGVCHEHQRGRYRAFRTEGSRTIYIGVFHTVVEAAVACARAVGQAELCTRLRASSRAAGARAAGARAAGARD